MGDLADEQEVFAADEEDVRKAEKIIENVSSFAHTCQCWCALKRNRYQRDVGQSNCNVLVVR